MDASLVNNHMWELRKAVFSILYAARSGDGTPVFSVRAPEHRFIYPVRLTQQPVTQSKGIEHFYGTAGDPISLAHQQATCSTLDNARFDTGKLSKLCSKDETCRPTTGDQYVHGLWYLRCVHTIQSGLNIRVAGVETIEMKLHWDRPYCDSASPRDRNICSVPQPIQALHFCYEIAIRVMPLIVDHGTSVFHVSHALEEPSRAVYAFVLGQKVDKCPNLG
ncbi:hypothetical protein D3C75_504750 [compost metagenome]